MQPLDYSYVFDDISNHLEPAQVFNHGTQQHAQVRIAVRDQVFRGQFGQPVPPLLADLTDLALAVYFADRLSRRERHQGRRIHIDLALRHMDHLAQPAIGDLLKLILHWFTGDRWSFSFRPRRSAGRFAELQYALFGPPRSEQPVEVALWSGGLDALAGLWNRLQRHPDRQYVLFGTGSHHATHHAQRVVADSVHHMTNASIALVQVPLALRGVAQVISRNSQRAQRSNRARGFVFLLLGAVCACLEGQHTLHVYENGVGAINLPCSQAEVGLDHARSVHPLSLLYMRELVSKMLGTPFAFVNPFLFSTKAEMCRALATDSVEALACLTVSCDSRQRQRGQPPQCGRCSSCILRRQALAAAGIIDTTPYYRPSLTDNADRLHLTWMLAQITELETCLAAADPWQGFCNHPQYHTLRTVAERLAKHEPLGGMTDDAIGRALVRLYHQYVREWHQLGWPDDPTIAFCSATGQAALN